MTEIENLGRILILFGLLLLFIGIAFVLSGRIPLIGRLPGDIYIQRDGASCWFPITTMIVISILLSILISLIGLLFRR
ncbi:MAG: DUF2905 domain-containing protein [Chloroflexi bacterium]|nr:DUF2905 domain-containing protein [Chloroflexota bacterium]